MTLKRIKTQFQPHIATPLFELRFDQTRQGRESLEIWQVPSVAQPEIRSPRCIARMTQRVWRIMEVRIRKILLAHEIRLLAIDGEITPFRLPEETALKLALIFKTLAPMRQRFKIHAVYDGIEAMAYEEAAYWLGMALYRPKPRKILAALRVMFA